MTATQSQPRRTEKFAKSIGGTLKSLVGSEGRTYFILEHKSASKKFRVGQTKEYIGDYIELGRGSSFAVNFGDDCPTVSRPHAAIIRKGSGWILRHLSNSNPTLLNGRRVSTNEENELKNGDEIQLSYEGPVVSFLTPANNSVKTLGMTVRLKAAANEAIRPYKTAVLSLAFLLLLAGSTLAYYSLVKTPELLAELEESKTKIEELEKIALEDAQKIEEANKKDKQAQQTIARLAREVGRYKQSQSPNSSQTDASSSAPKSNADAIEQLYPGVYFLYANKVTIESNGKIEEKEVGYIGSGFLLNDGKFVTARHVVEPWLYISGSEEDRGLIALNIIASNGGKVTHHISAFSPNGEAFTLRSTDFNFDDSKLVNRKLTTDDGETFLLKTAKLDDSDWAVCQLSNKKSNLPYDKRLSESLRAAETLYVLGYPGGLGVNSRHDIKPIYSECKVSRPGLDNGIINISARAFDKGNSGGPVFARVNNTYKVVGIVSAGRDAQGFIVPIGAIR